MCARPPRRSWRAGPGDRAPRLGDAGKRVKTRPAPALGARSARPPSAERVARIPIGSPWRRRAPPILQALGEHQAVPADEAAEPVASPWLRRHAARQRRLVLGGLLEHHRRLALLVLERQQPVTAATDSAMSTMSGQAWVASSLGAGRMRRADDEGGIIERPWTSPPGAQARPRPTAAPRVWRSLPARRTEFFRARGGKFSVGMGRLLRPVRAARVRPRLSLVHGAPRGCAASGLRRCGALPSSHRGAAVWPPRRRQAFPRALDGTPRARSSASPSRRRASAPIPTCNRRSHASWSSRAQPRESGGQPCATSSLYSLLAWPSGRPSLLVEPGRHRHHRPDRLRWEHQLLHRARGQRRGRLHRREHRSRRR